jgi:arylsulfatase A-like enzyme
MIKHAKHNLLLLTIDAWRADFIDTYAGISLTPSLQKLANHTLRFDDVYSTGPWTSPGIASIHTGKDAAAHRVWYPWSKPAPSQPAIASLLRKAGYTILNLCYKTKGLGCQNLGYDSELSPGYPTGPEDNFLPLSLGELASQGDNKPWFGWYHYKYVHLPYWSTADYRILFGVDNDLTRRLLDSVCSQGMIPRTKHCFHADDRPIIQGLYAANVRQMDDFLGRVFTSLSASGQLENTTIVITADHGDEHLEHHHVGHASTALHATLHEEVLRVPLLIIDSQIHGPRRSQARVQLQDLMPTLLSLAGVEPPPLANAVDLSAIVMESMHGHANDPLSQPADLGAKRLLRFHSSRMGYQTTRRYQGQSIRGFLEETTKYIFEKFDSQKRFLYDLAADPDEQNPITAGPAIDHAHKRLLALFHNPNLITSTLAWSEDVAYRSMARLHRNSHRLTQRNRR